jgi:hypothetical protein
MLDLGLLHLGCVDLAQGRIISSWVLTMSNCPFVAIGGNTEEESRMNKRLQSQARVVPGGQTLVCDIKMAKIKAFTICEGTSRNSFRRTAPGYCHVLDLSVEIRQMIWTHALHTEHSNVALVDRGNARFTSLNLRTPINRIHHVHRPFRDEAKQLELSSILLMCTNGKHLVELLGPSSTQLNRSLRRVTLYLNYESLESPDKAMLHSILQYARANTNVHMKISTAGLTYISVSANMLKRFATYGRGLRKAVRGTKARMVMVQDSGIVQDLRNGVLQRDLDANNVTFFPGETDFNERVFRDQVMQACKLDFRLKVLLAYAHTNERAAIEALVTDVRNWYEQGF